MSIAAWDMIVWEKKLKDHLKNRVLITGGAGFLGSHLCDHLLQNGHEFLCVDNYYTGTKRNIAHLLNNPAFELLHAVSHEKP